MPTHTSFRLATLAGSLLLSWPALAAENELAARLEALERELAQVKQELAEQKTTQDKQAQTIARAGSAARESAKTTVGGYGELAYNRWDNRLSGGADKDQLDLRRFVLYLGHDFNERLRFRSELEFAHAKLAGDEVSNPSAPGAQGEFEVEQALIEYDFNKNLMGRAGLMLMPIGILNETHEPATFYGVDRNPVETYIIPTTWREGGLGANYRWTDGFTLDAFFTSGLKLSAGDGYAVRDGRQHVAKAVAKDGAYTMRLQWNGLPGISAAASLYYQNDMAQGTDPTIGAGWLSEAHAIWNPGPFTLKALYAQWNISGSGPKATGANVQRGWYVEPSYRLNEHLGAFTRYNRWDNQAGNSADSQYSQWNVGLNYWLDPGVVLKADYQWQTAPAGKNAFNGINLGLGYQF